MIFEDFDLGFRLQQNLPLHTAEQCREIDRRAQAELHFSAYQLMQRAGEAAWQVLQLSWPAVRRIAVICCSGNNAGDAWVVARLAMQAGYQVEVFWATPEQTPSETANLAMQAWQQQGGEFAAQLVDVLRNTELLVDGLFGTGLTRPIQGELAVCIQQMNNSNKPTLALDIPSGICADTGAALGVAVKASKTISFIVAKPGLYTADAPDYCGEVILHDLALPSEWLAKFETTTELLYHRPKALPPRAATAHKGSAGRVLIIGGNQGMPGAVTLAGLAALRLGAGVVHLATHPLHAAMIPGQHPELIVHGVSDKAELVALMQQMDVLVIGPGLGTDVWAQELLITALGSDLPKVIDADGLNLLAGYPQVVSNAVFTPHAGEAARLLGLDSAAVQADRFKAISQLQHKHPGVWLLKGTGTLVARLGGGVELIARGSPALAMPGSGDVLSGCIAALMAQRLDLNAAASLAAWLHAVAGEMLATKGCRGHLASELLTPLHELINQ